MCGFVATLIPRFGNLLAHRGPSGSGGLSNNLPWGNISMEMSRLSIIDRREISVPFDFRKSCGVLLAYNGEIYNWQQLRVELSDGTPWETDCDAEVVARAWRRWSVKMLDRFNGMFGFVLVDVLRGDVLVARDRAGEKPLYYAPVGSGIAFASEIKALPIRLVEVTCSEMDVLEFDCLESTPFAGVRCLGPGEYIHFTSATDLATPQPKKWWILPQDVQEMSFANAVDEAEALVVDAIRIRARAEVPVAVQLSGGLDSAIIQMIAHSERLYTVTFPDDGIDCLSLARDASLGLAEPCVITFNYEDLVKVLPKVVWHLDTPATWTSVCQWFMNKKISEDGSIIVLSGEGADELFGGYARYRFLAAYDAVFADPRLVAYREAGERALGSSEDVVAKLLNRSGSKHLDLAKALVDRFGGVGDTAARMARIEWYTTMQVLLRMADRMSAAFGLENRSPFLDYRVVEFGATLPTRHKITATESKAVLCAVARHLGVPASVVDQPTKRGLFLPWAKWTGSRGWDRSGFAALMLSTWRNTFL